MSWWAGIPFIVNMGDWVRIQWMLAVLISGTQTTTKTTQLRRDNKNAHYCYLKTNRIQRKYRKRMIEMWANSVWYNTSQMITDQTKIIWRKCWFSELEILKVCEQINRETSLEICTKVNNENSLMRIETLNTENQSKYNAEFWGPKDHRTKHLKTNVNTRWQKC